MLSSFYPTDTIVTNWFYYILEIFYYSTVYQATGTSSIQDEAELFVIYFKLREDEENKCSCDGENKYPIDEKNKYPIDEENKYPIDEENDLSTDEENNLPCYPVDIAFACFLQVEKEYGG